MLVYVLHTNMYIIHLQHGGVVARLDMRSLTGYKSIKINIQMIRDQRFRFI